MATVSAVQRPPIALYIENRIMTGAKAPESSTRTIVRQVLRGGGSVIVVAGTAIGTISTCLKGSIRITGRTLRDPKTLTLAIGTSAGNLIANCVFGLTGTYAYVQVMTCPLTTEKETFLENIPPEWQRKAIIITATAAGILSEIKELYEAQAIIRGTDTSPSAENVFNVGSIALSAYSGLATLAHIRRRPYEGIEIRLAESRKLLADEIEERRRALVVPSPNRKDFLTEFSNFRRNNEGSFLRKSCSDFMQSILNFPERLPFRLGPLSDGANTAISLLCLPMTAALFTVIALCTNEGLSELFPSPYASWTATGLILASFSDSFWKGTTRAVGRLVDFLRGAPPETTHEVMPKVYKTANVVSALCACTTFIEQLPAASGRVPPWGYYPIGLLASLAMMFCLVDSMHDVRDAYIRSHSSHILLFADKQLKELSEFISELKLTEYAKLLLEMPDNLRSQWTNLSRQQLELYAYPERFV